MIILRLHAFFRLFRLTGRYTSTMSGNNSGDGAGERDSDKSTQQNLLERFESKSLILYQIFFSNKSILYWLKRELNIIICFFTLAPRGEQLNKITNVKPNSTQDEVYEGSPGIHGFSCMCSGLVVNIVNIIIVVNAIFVQISDVKTNYIFF
jgi:hypothetical protein